MVRHSHHGGRGLGRGLGLGLALIPAVLGLLASGGARAAECPGNPQALGTSRVMAIDPRQFPRIGTVQYSRSLPLEHKEVVLTFDDGPMPPYSQSVLDTLAAHCVKANYFIIGRMARGYPDLLRAMAAAGHVIGTHSQNHPLAFERMPPNLVRNEIEQGIASVAAALGPRYAPAPFFRIPGLLRAPHVESHLQSRGLMTWSADIVADDWMHLPASEIVRRTLNRLDEKGKGIILLHDIQPATALALPELLRELKARGYRVVQVVPATGGEPATAPAAVAATETKTPTQPPPPVAAATKEAVVNEAAPTPAGRPVPSEPVRPFQAEQKQAASEPIPDKLIAAEPGGWPRAVGVPLPGAGGVGVSSLSRTRVRPDGRFQ